MSFPFFSKALRKQAIWSRRGEPSSNEVRELSFRTTGVRGVKSQERTRSNATILFLLICVFTLSCKHKRSVVVTGSTSDNTTAAAHAININTASADDLQRIPHVGEKLAARIIEHRETNGPFRRVEHLMLIPGISDKRFRRIRPTVRVE